MLGRRHFAYLFLALIASLSGCNRDLGECNLTGVTEEGRTIEGPAAFDIAFRITDGLPMYEGQALIQSTCGNAAFCHSPAAVRDARIGAPFGLDFDVALACTDPTLDPTCADLESCEGAGADSAYCQRLQRLAENRQRTAEWGEGIIAEIRQGAMPPGDAGRQVRDNTEWIREKGGPLPSIESDEGKDIVRNWLACSAPVVARTELAENPADELTPCPQVDSEICVFSGPQAELPDPTWSSIYWTLIFTQCVVCHGPLNNNNNADDPNPNNPLTSGNIPGGADAAALAALNLAGSNAADTTNWASESHARVFNVPASSEGVCDGQGLVVVIENDSTGSSLMVQKLRATQNCGTEMPPFGGVPTISSAVVDVVEDWIKMGALNN